jgi:hypothetical protein
MLAHAVRVEAGPQIGFLRADAQRLPLRDETVDAVVSIAVRAMPGGGVGTGYSRWRPWWWLSWWPLSPTW